MRRSQWPLLLVVALVVVLSACSSSSKTNATETVGAGTATTSRAGSPASGASASASRTAASAEGGSPGAVSTAGEGTPVPGATAAPGSPVTGTGSPAPDTTPGSTPASQTTQSAGGGGPAFTLNVPSNPSRTFDVSISVVNPPAYRGFNVRLTYDPSVVEATGVDYGGVMGPKDGVLCVTPVDNKAGTAQAGCTLLGQETVTAAGTAAVVHFHVLKSGSFMLHITTYAEGSNATGALFLVPGGKAGVQSEGVDTPPDVTVPVTA